MWNLQCKSYSMKAFFWVNPFLTLLQIKRNFLRKSRRIKKPSFCVRKALTIVFPLSHVSHVLSGVHQLIAVQSYAFYICWQILSSQHQLNQHTQSGTPPHRLHLSSSMMIEHRNAFRPFTNQNRAHCLPTSLRVHWEIIERSLRDHWNSATWRFLLHFIG